MPRPPQRRAEVELTCLQASQDMIRSKRLLRMANNAAGNRGEPACGEANFCKPSKTARKSSGNRNGGQFMKRFAISRVFLCEKSAETDRTSALRQFRSAVREQFQCWAYARNV